jgi:hypothetical protein
MIPPETARCGDAARQSMKSVEKFYRIAQKLGHISLLRKKRADVSV